MGVARIFQRYAQSPNRHINFQLDRILFFNFYLFFRLFQVRTCVQVSTYSGTPPYGHLVNTVTSFILRSLIFVSRAHTFSYNETPLYNNAATPLTRPTSFHGPLVTVLTRFHCTLAALLIFLYVGRLRLPRKWFISK